VNAQLTAGLQQGLPRETTVALKRHRSSIEEQLEDLAEEQQRLQTTLGSGTRPPAEVMDLRTADRAPYAAGGAIALHSVSSSSGSQPGGVSLAGATGASGTSQQSPQLAALSRLAGTTMGTGTPVMAVGSDGYGGAGYNYPYQNQGGVGLQSAYGAGGAGSGTGYAPAKALFGAGSSSGSAYNGAAYTSNADTGSGSNGAGAYSYSSSGVNSSSSAGFTSHTLAPSSSRPAYPGADTNSGAPAGGITYSKTSAFAQDADFSQSFEDAVNDNDFTDWMGGDGGGPTYSPAEARGAGTGAGGGGAAWQGDNQYGNQCSDGYGAGGGSSTYSAYLGNASVIPQCNCGNVAQVCTSRQDASNGLRFYSCAQPRNSEQRCNFFQWEDPSLAPERTFNNSMMVGGVTEVMKDHKVEIRQRFGHVGFRQGQLECVEAALAGRDVFCLMPTGGGKSVVYQVRSVIM
jgi:hypothetical protein